MELVKIVWNDAQDFKTSTWASNDEIHEFGEQLCTVESVGWLVRKTKAYVTLASDFSPDPDTWGRIMKIPRKMIVSVTPIVGKDIQVPS